MQAALAQVQADLDRQRAAAATGPTEAAEPTCARRDCRNGDLIGLRLPRSLIGEPVKPGRAHLHLRDGALVTVTVPKVD